MQFQEWLCWAMVGWLCLCNIITFALCGWDKRCSKKRKCRRVPEKSFFLWALVGGSIGLWAGMYFFHHKTKHWYFVWGVPAIFLAQIAAVLYFFLT